MKMNYDVPDRDQLVYSEDDGLIYLSTYDLEDEEKEEEDYDEPGART